MCFGYLSNSFNPLTRVHGDRWESRDFGTYVAGLKEVHEGDIFDRVSGTLPHPLSPVSTTFDELVAGSAATAPR